MATRSLNELSETGFCVAAKHSISCVSLHLGVTSHRNRPLHAETTDHFVLAALWVTIELKYVNMTDINYVKKMQDDTESASGDRQIPFELIELLFFAYRDFVSDPDAILAEFGFGRAHHRVLHFVNRNPGITVTELLEILKITKQSLGRVLKQLVDTGFITQETGPHDRRQRLLSVTAAGHELAVRLVTPQSHRILSALDKMPPDSEAVAREFLVRLIDEAARPEVQRLTKKP